MTKPKPKLIDKLVFSIDKGVQMHGWGSRPPLWEKSEFQFIKKMLLNDSVFIGDETQMVKVIIASMRRFGQLNNRTFAFRKMKDGYRVWRIK